MRALRLCLLPLCLPFLMALDDSRKLDIPASGSSSQRVVALWNQTRPILLADAIQPLSDSQAMARGAPLIESWTALEKNLDASGGGSETRAVLKLLNDFYGRPGTPESRRVALRNDVRASFAERLALVDRRVLR